MKKTLLIVTITALTLLTLSYLYSPREAEAQSGTRRRRASGAKQAHYDHLWAWLKRSDYQKWNGADGTPPDFQKGQSPHGALIKTYISKRAAKDLENLPDGAVIVKENFSPEKKLMAITVMHRSTGYDREHGDWYYAKFMPNGKIARTPPQMKKMPIAGKFGKCIECHRGAGGKDFLFFND